MKIIASSAWKVTVTGDRIDWNTIRDRIDLARVVTALLGPAPGRRGERGRRLWWNCPLHEDRNPSFCVEPGQPLVECFGCGEQGDAAALVMKLNGVAFPEAVRIIAELSGIVTPSGRPAGPPPRPATPAAASKSEKAANPPPEGPSGLPLADALALVTEAAARLWTPEGTAALAYLHSRGLTDETIKAARLGVVASVSIPTREGGRCYQARGVVIPWFDGDRLALVKIRQPEGTKPKYAEAYRDRPRRLSRLCRHRARPPSDHCGGGIRCPLTRSGSRRPGRRRNPRFGIEPPRPGNPSGDAGRRPVVHRDRCRCGRGQGRLRLARRGATSPAAGSVQGLDRGRPSRGEPAPLVVRSPRGARCPRPSIGQTQALRHHRSARPRAPPHLRRGFHWDGRASGGRPPRGGWGPERCPR